MHAGIRVVFSLRVPPVRGHHGQFEGSWEVVEGKSSETEGSLHQ